MYGAFIGDIVGSKYEFHNIKTKEFPLFSEGCDYTDDTIMTVAVAKAILLRRQEQFEKGENGLLSGSARKIRNLTAASETVLPCGFPLAGWRRLPWKRLWHWHVPVPT